MADEKVSRFVTSSDVAGLPDPSAIRTRRDFARELTRAREQVGLTVREIAAALGVPASTLGGYFGGAHLPRSGTSGGLERILAICGVTEPGELQRWRQALRQARRGTARTPVRDMAIPVVAIPPAPETGPRREVGAVSTRPPVHRLAGEPGIRGRDALLDLLTAGLATDGPAPARVHVLHGLGGCGKSTVALALAARSVARGVRTWWVSADDPATATAGMRAVAVELGARPVRLRLGSGPDQLWRRLERLREPWLLIVDNVDDPVRTLAVPGQRIVDGTGWLRPVDAGYGMVVVTSRDGAAASWGPVGTRWLRLHQVRPLDDQDGARVLRELTGTGSVDSAALLSRRLGGLPLALRLAGQYLAETARIPAGLTDPAEPRTFDDYRRLLDQSGPGEVLRLTGADRSGDPGTPAPAGRASLHATWELSLDQLERNGIPEGRPMLRLLACFGPDPIPYALLLRTSALRESALLRGLSGRRMWTVLAALADVGLIELNNADPAGVEAAHTLVLPPVVRDAARAELAGLLPRYLATLTALLTAAVRDLDPAEPGSWSRWRAVAGHCGSPLDLAREHRLGPADTPPDVLTPAARAADYLRAAGDPGRAASLYPAVIEQARRLLGPQHPDVLALRHELSRTWYDAGQYNRAKRGLHEVLALRRAVLGPDHPDTLSTAQVLAQALRDHGQLAEAYARLQEVLDRRWRVLGPHHPDTLRSASHLAETARLQGRLAQAEQGFRRVRAARGALLPDGHPAILTSRLQLARLAGDRGEHARAEAELRALLAEFETRIGPEHPWTLAAGQALADCCHRTGRLDQAEQIVREVLHARHRVLGYDHPATLASRHRLGAVLQDRGDAEGAEKELQAVYDARGLALCTGHPDTARTARRLARLRAGRAVRADSPNHDTGAPGPRQDGPGGVVPRQLSGWENR